MAGKYHIWKAKDKTDYYEYIVCTRSANPSIGDPVDTSAYVNKDINENEIYFNFEEWNEYTVNDIKNETKTNYGGLEPFVTVVVDPYNYRISTVFGPGVVPKKYVWSNGSIADYYVSKYFWPNGVRYKVIFLSEYDPVLEGPYMGDYHSIPWDHDSQNNYTSVSNTPNSAYAVCLEFAGGYSMYSSALEDYYYFRINFTGPQ